jgi:signal transduction histidine kinase
LTARVAIASSVLALTIGAAFADLLRTVMSLRDAAHLEARSGIVLVNVNQFERLVLDLETGQRGFLLTMEERFLEPWEQARAALPAQARRLVTIVNGNHGQQQVARRIAEMGNAYLRDYSVPLVEAARRNDPGARSAATIEEGKARVDALRVEFAGFTATQTRLSDERQSDAGDLARRALITTTAGLAGSMLLVLLYAVYITRVIVAPIRHAADMAGQLAGGDLGARMPETGPGEIGTLQHSFNTMGDSLERGRDELTRSRARIVTAADDARRQIERDLHDGTQQRLVSLGLEVRAAEGAVPPDLPGLKDQLGRTADGLAEAVENLQEISRGIHPAILQQGGLEAALRALGRRSTLVVELEVAVERPLPEPVEVAVYYVVSEALTNAAKHARATTVHVMLASRETRLDVTITDDGAGGADPTRGTGLIGLHDRVESLGGTIAVTSPEGEGTTYRVVLPLRN